MSKTAILILVVISAVAGSFFGLWQGAKDEGNELRCQLALATIVGHAYEDQWVFDVLDWPDRPAEGLIIELYKLVDGETVLVAETRVGADGQYYFAVKPGTYYVSAVYGVPGYPEWGYIAHLQSPGHIRAKEGETYLGPIFLARENEGQG